MHWSEHILRITPISSKDLYAKELQFLREGKKITKKDDTVP